MPWSRRFDHCVVCGSAEHEHQARGLCTECYKRWLRERFALPEAATQPRPWSRQYDRCRSCGTTERRHGARGLCIDCYSTLNKRHHRSEQSEAARWGELRTRITREELANAYLLEGLSTKDLAKRYGCSHQAISTYLRRFGVPVRSASEAAGLAITQGKMNYTRETEEGVMTSVQLQKHVFNQAFFRSWTPVMAYVLGVIYTDGNLHHSPVSGAFTLSLSQKEPELLIKVRALLGSNARLAHRKKRGIMGEVHSLRINDRELYYDLCRLGLAPDKSRDVRFPRVPALLLRHFIRGCWDGDGTVYFRQKGPRGGAATFVSGSELFVKEMTKALCSYGLPVATIYHDQRGRGAWYIRYLGRKCAKLSHVLYDGVDEGMYLSRKHARFQQIAEYYKAWVAYR